MVSERIAVTGIGCVSPAGPDASSTFDAILQGRSFGQAMDFDTRGGPPAVGAPVSELPAGRIAEEFEVSRTAVSQHLGVLKAAGLLHERRDGTRRLYRARPEGLAGLQAFLDQMWAGSLETAKRLVEAERGISDDDGVATAG